MRNKCLLLKPSHLWYLIVQPKRHKTKERLQLALKLLYSNEVLEQLLSTIQLNTQGQPTMKNQKCKVGFISHARCETSCSQCNVANNFETVLRFGRKGLWSIRDVCHRQGFRCGGWFICHSCIQVRYLNCPVRNAPPLRFLNCFSPGTLWAKEILLSIPNI